MINVSEPGVREPTESELIERARAKADAVFLRCSPTTSEGRRPASTTNASRARLASR